MRRTRARGVGVGAGRGGRPLTLRGRSFPRAMPQGKGRVTRAEETEKNPSKTWFKCSDCVSSDKSPFH